jgi:DNA polymerase-3 subunit delta'
MAKDKDELPPDSLHAPLCESELHGHDAAERALLDAWASGRLHHAWLIVGPAGVGKATLACRFARFLLAHGTRASQATEQGPGLFGDAAPVAETPTSLYVPPSDPVFHRIAVRGHADLSTVTLGYDAKRNRERKVIVVDDVRDIRNFISLTPAEDGYRVVIIDGAEDMNKNAANALLKMLEEPPPRTIFLLISHAPGRLLPTIRSRCRTLTLRALSDETLAALLARHKPDLPPGDTAALLRIAEGSIGRALRLADEGGVALYREMVGLLSRLPDLDTGAVHAFGDKLARPNGIAAYNLFGELLRWWLARMVRSGAAGAAEPEIVTGEQGLMRRLAAVRSLDQWVEVWEKIADLFTRAASVNLDRKQTVLSALLTLQASARG